MKAYYGREKAQSEGKMVRQKCQKGSMTIQFFAVTVVLVLRCWCWCCDAGVGVHFHRRHRKTFDFINKGTIAFYYSPDID